MNSFEAERVRIAREHAPPCEVHIDLDGCVRCAEPWWSCMCDPTRRRHARSSLQLERARDERLTKAERAR